MKDNFFAIRLILKYGVVGAVVIALLVGVGVTGFLWATLGWIALVPGLLLGGFAFLMGKSYVELVAIVFQMVH